MRSAPTDLVAYRHEKYVAQLETYISKCYSITVFFGTAYLDSYGCHDRYEVQCDIEKYRRSTEIPDYVIAYLKKLQ